MSKITLSGKSLTDDGKIEKTGFFDCLKLDLDKYDDIVYTEEEARRIKKHVLKLQTGATAMVPLFCSGSRCPLKDRCPLFQANKPPIGRTCPIESSLMNTWTIQYMNEYNVDPNNLTERGYTQELAHIDVLLLRINIQLAKAENALMLIDQAVGVDKEGEPIFRQEISPLVEQREKLLNRRSRVVKLMVGDPQEKYKKQAALKQQPDADPATQQTATKKKLNDLQRQLDSIQGNTFEEGARDGDVLLPQDIIDAEE